MRESMSSVQRRLKKQFDAVDLKLKRQLDVIEAGVVDIELVGSRIQELREERERANKEFQDYQTQKPIPKSVHSQESIRSIQSSLKQLFLTPDSAVAKRYVHYLVDEIVVNGPDVRIRGNTTAFLNTLAQKNNVRTGNSPVLTLGHDWLRTVRIQRTAPCGWYATPVYRSISDGRMALVTEPPIRTKHEKPGPRYPVGLALALRRMLEQGEVKNQSELAQLVGISRAHVAQLLNLLKLPQRIVQELSAAKDHTKGAFFTERRLRHLTSLANDVEQENAFQRLQQEFAGRSDQFSNSGEGR